MTERKTPKTLLAVKDDVDHDDHSARPLAVVIGTSSGIGYELGQAVQHDGFDLLIVADEPEIMDASRELERMEPWCRASRRISQPSKATIDCWPPSMTGRSTPCGPPNAGRGLGRAFLDQDFKDVRRVIDTNVTGTVYLIQRVGRKVRSHGNGRI